MKKLHRTVSDQSELEQTTLSQNLEKAQLKALEDCAAALQSVVDLHEIVIATKHPTQGNIRDSKESLCDAMANLAIFASKGLGRARIQAILAGYGLEEIF